jgi:hypothetical protein
MYQGFVCLFLLTHLGFPIRIRNAHAIGTGFSPSFLFSNPSTKKQPIGCFFVDPPGLEPGLCGTKIRRVANYTMGQYPTNEQQN